MNVSKMNNTTLVIQNRHINEFQLAQIILLSGMLVACLFGNILVIAAITRTKKLRTPSNLLIINLSVCDIMTSVCAIPFSGIIFNIYYASMLYPYGKIGCKLLWPLTTYASNCSVFTLAIIAVERYLNISSVRGKFSKRSYVFAIILIHISAMVAVIPYSVTLKYAEVSDTQTYCYEEWSAWQRKVYTLCLFSIQYLMPLAVMAVFYLLAWRKLYAHNISMIKMTEEYEQKMDWDMVPYRKKSQASIMSNMSGPKIPEREFSTTSECSNSPYTHRMSNIEKKLSRRKEGEQRGRRSSSHSSLQGSIQTNGRGSVNEDKKESDQKKSPNRRRTLGYSSPINGENSVTTYKYTSKRRQSRCGGSIVSIEKETYRRKTSTVSFSSARTASVRSTASIASNASPKDMKRFNKSRYSSQAAFTRHNQTVRTLRMFTAVVFVFACFALPNQISWLLMDFGSSLPRQVSDIFIILTYVSSVMNCWIYGGFHSGIRKAYIDIVSCCFCRPKKRRRCNTNSSRTTTSTVSSSLYDSMQEELFRRRMSTFNHIFEDVNDNFENVQHLYQSADNLDEVDEEEEEEEEGLEKTNEIVTDDLYCELEEDEL